MSDRCPFCTIYIESRDKILAANEHAFAVYDINPQSKGHVLIITKRHVPSYFEMKPEEVQAMFEMLRHMRSELKKQHNPSGFNIQVNDGKAAGQIIFHTHMHLIPRYGETVE